MTNVRFSTPPPSLPFPPGTVLAGKYRVERLIGAGGMGWVILTTHLQLEQRVALKFMHSTLAATNPDAVARFLREARAAARIQSEHVARVSDVGTLDDGAPYLVMEYLEGEDLESLLRSSQALPLALAVDYATQACEGLAEAHAAGVVHRDLKPANLFLARRTDGSVRVKLLDFGISKMAPVGGVPDAAMTSTQALMGSPLYMSPEQLRSSKNVDRRTDIWSMGVILYEMFGGRAPFEADTLPEVCARIMAEPPISLSTINPRLPPALDGVIMRCLEKEPQRRFADVAGLASALAPFGSPESRLSAERIARLARASAPASTEIAPRVAATPPGAVGGGQTNVSFGTMGSLAPRRSAALPFAIGGGVMVVGASIALFVLMTRARPAVMPAVPVVSAPATTASVVASAEPPPAPPTAAPAVASTATPSATAPVASAPPIATAAVVAPTSIAPRPQPRPRPTATAKPANTSGFGGRD